MLKFVKRGPLNMCVIKLLSQICETARAMSLTKREKKANNIGVHKKAKTFVTLDLNKDKFE